MKHSGTPNITTALSSIAGSGIHPDFGEPFKSMFAAHYPNGSDEEITVAAYICSLFLSSILKGFPTDKLHVFVHYAKDECSRFTFDCKMYDTLVGSIDGNSLKMVPLMDNCGNTAHCECRKEEIMEAFDFYTNR